MNIFETPFLQSRRQKVQVLWQEILQKDDLILIHCGQPIQKPGGLDQTYDFLPHPDYYWLTGARKPSGVVAFAVEEGWVDFFPYATPEELLWEGGSEDFSALPAKNVNELQGWVSSRRFNRIISLGQVPGDWSALSLSPSDPFFTSVQELLYRVRRQKDFREIQLIQSAAQMALEGYRKIQSVLKPGLTERQIQIEYESEVLKAGAHKFPYGTIVGSGVRASVLHAVPSTRKIQTGEWVLIDAGADVFDYCVDITRMFAVDVVMSSQQKDIYEIVLRAQQKGIESCQVGQAWADVHLAVAQVLAEGLKSLQILRGPTDSLIESGAVSLFFPHGVGHMVGLRVRDVGGVYGRPLRQVNGVRLRVDLDLEEDFVMTVEPGLYFVPALLDDPKLRSQHRSHVNWSEVEKWRSLGGLRVEDDIWVRSSGPVNLTAAVPK